MFDLIIQVNTGMVPTGTDGHKDDNTRLRAENQHLRMENVKLRLYTEWIQESLKVLPTTVSEWVEGIIKMSPLNKSDEPPVEQE